MKSTGAGAACARFLSSVGGPFCFFELVYNMYSKWYFKSTVVWDMINKIELSENGGNR